MRHDDICIQSHGLMAIMRMCALCLQAQVHAYQGRPRINSIQHWPTSACAIFSAVRASSSALLSPSTSLARCDT